MTRITPQSLMSLEAYARIRTSSRAAAIQHRQPRNGQPAEHAAEVADALSREDAMEGLRCAQPAAFRSPARLASVSAAMTVCAG